MCLLSIGMLLFALIVSGCRIVQRDKTVRTDPFLRAFFRCMAYLCLSLIVVMLYVFGIVRKEQVLWPIVFTFFGLTVEYIYNFFWVFFAFVGYALQNQDELEC